MTARSGLRVSGRPAGGRQNRFILITGGTRSGKSRFAVELARHLGRHIIYLATGRATDHEMQRRIAQHQRQRPRHWKTVEHCSDPAERLIQFAGNKVAGVIIDCLTMHVSALVARGDSDTAVRQQVRRLCHAIRRVPYPVVMVTNEVGSGVVPAYELGRRFRDLAGMANQIAAGCADQVFVLVAGIPLEVKGTTA